MSRSHVIHAVCTSHTRNGDWALVCSQVNIGMQFVKAGRHEQAIRFLEAVIAQYRLEPVEEFCAGQIAIGEVLGLYDSYDAQLGICAQVLFWPNNRRCSAVVLASSGKPVRRRAELQTTRGPEHVSVLSPTKYGLLWPCIPSRAQTCSRLITIPGDDSGLTLCTGREGLLCCADGGPRPAQGGVPLVHALQLLQPGAALCCSTLELADETWTCACCDHVSAPPSLPSVGGVAHPHVGSLSAGGLVLHGPTQVDEAAGLPPGLPGERCVRAAFRWLAQIWDARRL